MGARALECLHVESRSALSPPPDAHEAMAAVRGLDSLRTTGSPHSPRSICALTRVPSGLLSFAMRGASRGILHFLDPLAAREQSVPNCQTIVHNASDFALGSSGSPLESGTCDFVLMGFDQEEVDKRQAVVLSGLTRAFPLARHPATFVAVGHDCTMAEHRLAWFKSGGACMRRAANPKLPAEPGVQRSPDGRLERYPCEKREECWLGRWKALEAQHDLLERGECATVSWPHPHGSRMVCVARVTATPSLCAQHGLLEGTLGEEISWWPREASWRRKTVRKKLLRNLRYLTALPCDGRVCLVFKDANYESFVSGISSEDGLRFDSVAELVMPRMWRIDARRRRRRFVEVIARLTHNLAIAHLNGSYYVAGGRYRPDENVPKRELGIWISSSKTWRYNAHGGEGAIVGDASARGRLWLSAQDGLLSVKGDRGVTSSWVRPHIALEGQQPGCIERRNLTHVGVPAGACEFDGRVSLAHYQGKFWLYARANLARRGQRFVQVASSQDTRVWSRFELIRLRGYAPTHGDIYFFAAQANPVDTARSMVAVFPLVHRAHACICVAFSRDGVRWSAPRPLRRCEAAGERSINQPAAITC